MREFVRAGFFALAGSFLLIGHAIAQPAANVGCTATPSAAGTQTWRCDNGITIVAESGARFELKDANRDGHIDSVELSSKALLVEVPKKPGGNPFQGADAAGDRRGARHEMGGRCRRGQDLRLRG